MAPTLGERGMNWNRRHTDLASRAGAGTTELELRRTTGQSAGLSSLPPAPSEGLIEQRAGGSFIVDDRGTLLAFDRNMERLTGWNAYEIVGQPKDLGLYDSPDENGQRRYRALPLYEGPLPRATQSITTQLTVHRKDGARLEVEALVSPLGPGGSRYSVEIQRIMARVPSPVNPSLSDGFDALTGLPDTATFRDKLKELFANTRQAGRPMSLLLIDIDKTYDLIKSGTQLFTDDVVRRIAGVLQASVRMSDVIARIGQGQFAMVLDGTGRGDARAVGGRIRGLVERFSFGTRVDGQELKASVSIGVACYPADGDNPGELLRRADEALKEAHRLGSNRVWCYVRRPRVDCNTEVFFDGPEGQMLGMARDLSNSGLFVETHDQLPEGMRLGLRFSLPVTGDEVHVVGRVARRVLAGGLEGSSMTGLGIEFERYSDTDRWRLESYLHKASGSAASN